MDKSIPAYSYKCTIQIPALEDLDAEFDVPAAPNFGRPDGTKELIAVGTAVYEGVKPAAYDSHRNLAMVMAHDLGLTNVWQLHTHPRLPYPFSPLYAVSGMFKTEQVHNRKCDWLLWIDDDVVVPGNLLRVLRAAADPVERPFVTAVAHDRFPPFRAAIWDTFDAQHNRCFDEKALYRKQWVARDPKSPDEVRMPDSGTHRIAVTGLCAALIHRSLFDKVPQPWFAVLPGDMDGSGNICHKINTDSWWCQQVRDAGFPVYACCDAQVTHLGFQIPVSTKSAALLESVFTRDKA